MFKIFRIISCLISVALAAAAIFVFVYAGWVWGIVCVVACALFFGICVFCKNKQETIENPPQEQGDFFHPIHKDE